MACKIGVIRLEVMGHNLALNMERNGFPVAGYDLDAAKTWRFLPDRRPVRRSSAPARPRS